MAISDTQKTDYLWKKLGYGVAKTDLSTAKQAYEESIPSPLLLRGDKIWQQSDLIPGTMPSTSSDIVTIYKDGTGSWSATIKCTEDLTSNDNRTWKTNLTNWISSEFGSAYQVQVYIANDNATNPQSTGTKIFAAGSGNNDEWFFDYQAGILHFIGVNIPTAIAGGVTGKSIFISGARYAGVLGLSQSVATSATIGNISISSNKIESTGTDQDIVIDPKGTGNTVINGNLVANDIYGNLHFTGSNAALIFIDNGIANSSGQLTFDSTSNILTLNGNANVQGGTLTLNGGTLAVSGANAGIFNLGISNVSLGLAASSVTIGSSGGTVTARGNLVANNIVGINFVGNHTGINVTTNTVIDSFEPTLYRTAKYLIKAGNDDGFQSIEVLLIHDNIDSYITIYGAVSSVDTDIIEISSNILNGNVQLYATGSNANTVVNVLGTYVKD